MTHKKKIYPWEKTPWLHVLFGKPKFRRLIESPMGNCMGWSCNFFYEYCEGYEDTTNE